MKILVIGGPSKGQSEMLKHLEAAGAELVYAPGAADLKGVLAEQAPSDLVWMDEIAEIPQDRYTVVEPKTTDLEYRIPEPTERELRLPYRDKKVMHPWRRRKKR